MVLDTMFSTPNNLVFYIANSFANNILKVAVNVSAGTASSTVLAGSGATGSTEGTGLIATFNQPVGLAALGSNLYVSDKVNFKIRKIFIDPNDPSYGRTSHVAGGSYSDEWIC